MLGRDRGARYSRAFARQSTDWCLPVTCHIVPRNGLDRHRSQRRFCPQGETYGTKQAHLDGHVGMAADVLNRLHGANAKE